MISLQQQQQHAQFFFFKKSFCHVAVVVNRVAEAKQILMANFVDWQFQKRSNQFFESNCVLYLFLHVKSFQIAILGTVVNFPAIKGEKGQMSTQLWHEKWNKVC